MAGEATEHAENDPEQDVEQLCLQVRGIADSKFCAKNGKD